MDPAIPELVIPHCRSIRSALESRRAFAVVLILLALQVVLAAYSFSHRAHQVAMLDGSEPEKRVGVYDARWAYLRVAPVPSATIATPTVQAGAIGFRYTYFPNWYFFGTIHFAWTMVPNVFVAAYLGRHQLRVRRAESRRHIGLCGVCNYDLRASDASCPECGFAIAPPLRVTLDRINRAREVALQPAPTGC
jgi:hypothetical protein